MTILTKKMRAFMGQKSQKELQLIAEREKVAKEMALKAKDIAKMVVTPGWKLLEEFLNLRIKSIHLELEKARGRKKIWRLQNEIKTIKSILGFLTSQVAMHINNQDTKR